MECHKIIGMLLVLALVSLGSICITLHYSVNKSELIERGLAQYTVDDKGDSGFTFIQIKKP